MGPPFLADGHGRAQVDVVVLMGDRSRLPPPVEEPGLPALEGSQQPSIVGQPDVVGDLLAQIDMLIRSPLSSSDPAQLPQTRRRSYTGREPVP